MDSILTIVTPADSQDLTCLATVKTELEITDTSEDAQLQLFIDQASNECATYCKRVFGLETVSEQFRLGQGSRLHRRSRTEELVLARYPIASITSITEEDGTVLVQDTDYELDPNVGIAWRLSGAERCGWRRGKTVVVYVGGYELLDSLPQTIERACIELVKAYYFAASRDPALRQISLPGVGERQYWVGPKGEPALPAAVTDRLDQFCDMRF